MIAAKPGAPRADPEVLVLLIAQTGQQAGRTQQRLPIRRWGDSFGHGVGSYHLLKLISWRGTWHPAATILAAGLRDFPPKRFKFVFVPYTLQDRDRRLRYHQTDEGH